jgi:hypothetical protein
MDKTPLQQTNLLLARPRRRWEDINKIEIRSVSADKPASCESKKKTGKHKYDRT